MEETLQCNACKLQFCENFDGSTQRKEQAGDADGSEAAEEETKTSSAVQNRQRRRKRRDLSGLFSSDSDSDEFLEEAKRFGEIMTRPARAFGTKVQNFMKNFNENTQGDNKRQAEAKAKETSSCIQELLHLTIYVVEETVVLEDFKEPSGHVQTDLLLNQLLLPFFQLRTRVVAKNSFFEIGKIKFYIAATTPADFGKVSSRTILSLSQTVST